MRKLPKPTDHQNTPYVARKVFELCVSDTENAALKKRLVAATPDIENAAKGYDVAAAKTELHTIPLGHTAGALTQEELVRVYTYRMVHPDRPGRVVYDRIFASAPYQVCPLCGLNSVSSLDHHLPKAEYPTLAVVPNNLVPACGDCQDAKKSHYPTTVEQHTLHPYFDDYESVRWLAARIDQTEPLAFEFFVNATTPVSAVEMARLNTHLGIFKLQKLYASNAGSELAGAQGQLHRLLVNGGENAVREHCLEVAASWGRMSINSWKSAMYAAAADNDWFCRGGFMAGNAGKDAII